ncbi:hypothetical protein FOIG_03217 [Fusarium odoratissimum NRRL 54006]|uniref:Uncharacterized protein n=2 Tax=Fusarium oxysporum species complex TaxID=171631 RepID=X0LC51_FUSO5|nr:uncharacterized protein FOIG_03217 [Fusarium odoratissimum NRRL 54006]EXM06410.1 hypothetical protein FOIG_03217 [Fusarium odoratissimum NRRL 54006]TXC08480.1 hypothetical protein FocTR4_00003149 [Fusarium oxysporum f. sp. cubense]
MTTATWTRSSIEAAHPQSCTQKRHRCSPQLSFPFMTDSDATHQLQIRQRRKSLYLTTIHDWYIIAIFHRLQTYTRISRLCWSTVALGYPHSRPLKSGVLGYLYMDEDRFACHALVLLCSTV